MKKNFFALLLLFPALLFSEPVSVLVSVAPYIEIVKRVGGDAVDVKMLVPEGIDSHTFEPSPETLKEALKGKVWFQVGECFEHRVEEAMHGQKSSIETYDLRKALPSNDHDNAHDPHIWMSPALMMPQAKMIAAVLEEKIPDSKEAIEKNLHTLLNDLQTLSRDIQRELASKKGGIIVTAHPSYTLFCEEFHLVQLSIEGEGKEPTLKELATLIQQMKTLHIRTIFAQSEYGHKGAEALAADVHAHVQYLPAASPRYFEMMHAIADAFAKEAIVPQ